jgi:osmoprotectant transport system ATP-binding protein
VIDESGAYSGVVDIDTINEAIRGMRTAERSRLRSELDREASEGTGVASTP